MKVRHEKITHPSQSFRFLRYETASFRSELHRHQQIELTWIEQGKGLRLVGDSVQPFAANDLVLLGAQVPHAWLTSPLPPSTNSMASVIQFSPDFFASSFFPELAAMHLLAERSRLGLSIAGVARRSIIGLLKKMPSATPVKRLACLIDIFALLLQHEKILSTIAQSALHASDEPGENRPERRIDLVIRWIHRHLADELSVHAAAQIACVTPAAFSRFFYQEMGKPFVQYINDVRCSSACLRLHQSEKPVARIAEECGFSTLSHFNRQFMQRMGVSPRRFRTSP